MTDEQAIRELVKLCYPEGEAAKIIAYSTGSVQSVVDAISPRRPNGMQTVHIPPCEWTIRIPGWHPTSVNKLIGGHWSIGRKKKKADMAVIGLYVQRCGIPPAVGKRKVSVHFVLAPKQRASDPDNVCKVLFDGLVHAGAIRDDNRKWIEQTPPTFSRGAERVTFITVEEIG